MTTNQLIALMFPVFTGAGAIATVWLAKKIWVDRLYPEEIKPTSDDREDLQKASNLIREAERIIEKAML